MVDTSKIEKILIVDMARLGDVTLASPVIANLRKNHPDARIEFLVSETAKSVVLNNPKLNEVHVHERPDGSWLQQWNQINDIASTLRQKRFDAAFLLHRSFAAALIAWRAGIPIRIGHNTQGRGILLTVRVKLDTSSHRMDNNLNLLKAVNEPISVNKPEYFPADEIGAGYKEAFNFKGNRKLIAINPNGVWDTKRWQTDKFAELANRITSELNANVVVIGGDGDEERGKTVSSGNFRILDLTSKTSVDDLYRIMTISDLVITNDSGPMHIAATTDTPIIAIFGPTDPRRCGPKNEVHEILTGKVDCLRCYKKTCEERNLECMRSLSVDDVMACVNKFIV